MAIRNDLKIVQQPPAALHNNPRNARTHSERQIGQIMASIRRFGFTSPVLVTAEKMIVAGHGRVEAARRLGLTEVPTIALDGLSPEELRAYVLADNKLALNAGWDEEMLRIELGELCSIDLDFEIDLTGFGAAEIDVLLDGKAGPDPAGEEEEQPLPAGDPVSRRGDLWVLGRHRLLCGDAREAADFARLMEGEKAQMVFSDPPYNVKVDGFVGGLGAVKHAEFAMASGEMTTGEFEAFLRTAFANLEAASVDGSLHYLCMDWRHMDEMLAAGRQVYSELKNVCVWAKDSAGMGALYRSQHELVFVWKAGTAPHINNVELGKNGRYRTNVWNCRGARKGGKKSELALHPTVKPVPLIVEAICDVTRQGDVVLDAFGGSGSTLMAAQRCRRRARLIEYEPKYVDVALRRWMDQTREQPLLEETGESFAEVKLRREAEIERAADLALGEVTR